MLNKILRPSAFVGAGGRQRNGPQQRPPCIVPGTCEYVGYMERGIVLAGGLEVTSQLTSRWGDYPGLSLGTHCNHKGPYEWKARERENLCQSDVRRKTPPAILGAKDEGRGHEPRNVGCL